MTQGLLPVSGVERSDYPSTKVVATTKSPLFRLLLSSTNTMAASSKSIPRFLLPKLSWSAQTRSTLNSVARLHTPLPPSSTMNYTTRALARAQHFPSASRIAAGQAVVQPRRHFSASVQRSRDHHFDTLKFVQRLKDEGFTEEQAVAMMKVLSDVVEERYILARRHSEMRPS